MTALCFPNNCEKGEAEEVKGDVVRGGFSKARCGHVESPSSSLRHRISLLLSDADNLLITNATSSNASSLSDEVTCLSLLLSNDGNLLITNDDL